MLAHVKDRLLAWRQLDRAPVNGPGTGTMTEYYSSRGNVSRVLMHSERQRRSAAGKLASPTRCDDLAILEYDLTAADRDRGPGSDLPAIVGSVIGVRCEVGGPNGL